MNSSDSASKSVSHTNIWNQSLPGAGVPTLPLPVAGGPNFNHAIALQQYHFQQALANQQLLAQQQAVAHAVSIKSATEQAAARAAEISKLLKGENNDALKGKAENSAPRRESSESKSRSRSSSPRFSKSKSVSPVRCRSSHRECEEYSPRERSSYRINRHSSYYKRYDRDYHASSYRRYADRSSGRRSNLYYRGSPSRLRSMRYRRDDSRSPRHHHIRSRSPKSVRRISPRVPNWHSMSRSPISGSSISLSPLCARIISPRRPTGRSLSSLETSPSRRTSSLPAKDDRVNRDVISSDNASDPDFRQREKGARPLGKQLERSESSNSSSRLRSSFSDYSGERSTREANFKKGVSSKFAYANGDDTCSARSDGGLHRRASCASDDESGSTASALPRSADNTDGPTRILDCQPSRKDGVTNDNHDGIGILNSEPKSHNVMERKTDQDHMETPSVNRHPLSPEYSLSDHGGLEKYYDEEKENTGEERYLARELHSTKAIKLKSLKLNRHEYELQPKVISSNEGLAHSDDKEIDSRTKVKSDCGTCSEDDDVNDSNHPTNQRGFSHSVEISVYPNMPIECAIYPLPEDHESMDGKLLHHKSLEELNQEQENGVKSSLTIPGGAAKVDNEQVSLSSDACQYPGRRFKQGSRSRERRRKHRKRRHKRHQREGSEEDDNHRKETQKESKLKKHRRKDHRKHDKIRKDRTRKRKHRDTSSNSSDNSFSSSSVNEYRKEYHDVHRKGSTGSRKKRRHSPSASTSSSL